MDRTDWLKEQRREAEEGYDKLWAPLYDEKWGVYSNASHQQFIQTFLGLLSEASTILDAACGAGRYMAMLLEKDHTVIGIDQAQGMLTQAREKFLTVHLEKIGLYGACLPGRLAADPAQLSSSAPATWIFLFHRGTCC